MPNIKKFLILISGLLTMGLIEGIELIYKKFIYTGNIEHMIKFMFSKVYANGMLFSLVFILLFSFTYKKLQWWKIALFSLINGAIYIVLILLISNNDLPFPINAVVDDIRLVGFTAIGALCFFSLLNRFSRLNARTKDYLIITALGMLPALFQIIFHHNVNNTDRGQGLINAWQFIIPLAIIILLLLPKRSTEPQTV